VTSRRHVVLSVGSNLGDRLGTLQECVTAIGALPDTDVLAISPVYQTAPVVGPPQPDSLNAVLAAATGLRPADLLATLHGLEADFGRNGSGRRHSTSTSSATPASAATTRR
jgi:2-amino-4-hydroxy-6-hydroxymethyldihydropteridine diphosphokinase